MRAALGEPTVSIEVGLVVPISTFPFCKILNALFAAVSPPANVLVAVGPVAVNESAVGDELATILPLPSVERIPQGIEVIANDDVLPATRDSVPAESAGNTAEAA